MTIELACSWFVVITALVFYIGALAYCAREFWRIWRRLRRRPF